MNSQEKTPIFPESNAVNFQEKKLPENKDICKKNDEDEISLLAVLSSL